MLTRGRSVGVEAAPGKLVGVELSATGISRASVVEMRVEGLERVPFESALDELGAKGRSIHLVTWDPEHLHRTLLLPPMTAAERSLFLDRELAREGGPAKAFDSRIVRQVADGARKDEVLVVAVPRDRLDQLLAPFLAVERAPRLVTTAPLALIKAAEGISPRLLDRPTILGHWGLSGLTVAVVAGGALRLARQIPHLAVPGLDAREWLVTEIQRSVLHYAQLSQGAQVEQMLFGYAEGLVDRAFADSAALGAQLGIPVINLNEAVRSLLPADAEEEARLPAGAFLLPLGAALLSPTELPNLLPRGITIDRVSRHVTRAALVAGTVVALTLGWSLWGAVREAAVLRRAVAGEQQARQVLQATLGDVQRIEGERQRIRRWIRFLADDPLGTPPFANVLREVSRLAPDHLRLERLVISKGEQGYTMRLVGSVRRADLAQAQSEFNRLYFGLQESPLFYDVTFLPQADTKGGPVVIEARPQEAMRATEEQLNFEITLRLKEMPRWTGSL